MTQSNPFMGPVGAIRPFAAPTTSISSTNATPAPTSEQRLRANSARIKELEAQLHDARDERCRLKKNERHREVAEALVPSLKDGGWLMPCGMGKNVAALESRNVIIAALEEYLKA